MHRVTQLKLTQINEHLMCVLCGGYLIDATISVECLHAFCRSCITKYTEGCKTCPICDTLIHKTRPILNLRPDKTLQDLVYKLVPGLFENEMKRRREFYAAHPDEAGDPTSLNADEERGQVKGQYNCARKVEEEKISLCLQVANKMPPYKNPSTFVNSGRERMKCDCRYLLCPSGMTIGVLEKFIRIKFDLKPHLQVDVYHSDEALSIDMTLQDVASLFGWLRRAPLRLYYLVYDPSEMVIKLPEPLPAEQPLQIQTEPTSHPDSAPNSTPSAESTPDCSMPELASNNADNNTNLNFKTKKKKKKKKREEEGEEREEVRSLKITLKTNQITSTAKPLKKPKRHDKHRKKEHKKVKVATQAPPPEPLPQESIPAPICSPTSVDTMKVADLPGTPDSVSHLKRFGSFDMDLGSNESVLSMDSSEDYPSSDYSSAENTPQKLSVERIDNSQNGIRIRIRRSSGKEGPDLDKREGSKDPVSVVDNNNVVDKVCDRSESQERTGETVPEERPKDQEGSVEDATCDTKEANEVEAEASPMEALPASEAVTKQSLMHSVESILSKASVKDTEKELTEGSGEATSKKLEQEVDKPKDDEVFVSKTPLAESSSAQKPLSEEAPPKGGDRERPHTVLRVPSYCRILPAPSKPSTATQGIYAHGDGPSALTPPRAESVCPAASVTKPKAIPKSPTKKAAAKRPLATKSNTECGPASKAARTTTKTPGPAPRTACSAFVEPSLPPPHPPQLFSPSFHYPHSPIFSQYQYSPVNYHHGSSPRHVPLVYTALSPADIPSPTSTTTVVRCNDMVPLELTTQEVRNRHRDREAGYSFAATTRRMS